MENNHLIKVFERILECQNGINEAFTTTANSFLKVILSNDFYKFRSFKTNYSSFLFLIPVNFNFHGSLLITHYNKQLNNLK